MLTLSAAVCDWCGRCSWWGGNADAEFLSSMLMTDPTLGYHVAGHVADGTMSTRSPHLPPIMGSVAETLEGQKETVNARHPGGPMVGHRSRAK